jgi:hypothetical protein
MSLPFDPAGYGQAIRNQEVAKNFFSTTARNARRAARAGRREERIAARGGHLIQRKVTKPIRADLNDAMTDVNSQIDTGVGRIQRAGEDAANLVGNSGKRAGMYIAGGTGLGLAGGIGGGMTLGAAGRRIVDPNRQRREEKRRKRDFTLAKAEYDDDLYAYRRAVEYDIGLIPRTRRNPVSPLEQWAASRIIGEGMADVRSRNPFFRRSRIIRGTQEMVLGSTMVQRGVGERL